MENIGRILQFLASFVTGDLDQIPVRGATIHRITSKAFSKIKRDDIIKETVLYLENRNLVRVVSTDDVTVKYGLTQKGLDFYYGFYRPTMETLGFLVE